MKISEEGRAVDQEAEQDGGRWRIPYRKSLTWKPMLERVCLLL